MSFKRKKVVMLPTEKSSDIILRTRDNVIHQRKYYGTAWEDMGDVYQHLYFLSDDEIKKGDWCYDEHNKVVFQNNSSGTPGASKKIIATTDKLRVITKDEFSGVDNQHLPEPSQGFIQKFVDSYNSSKPIGEVDVEYEEYFEYDIMNKKESLKVNSKDNTITTKKVKDSWTRDEVVDLFNKMYSTDIIDANVKRIDFDKWVEENL